MTAMGAPIAAAGDAPAGLLARQRATFLREGPPSLQHRRAVVAGHERIEAAISADFGHRSRHETAAMEIFPLLQGIDYLHSRLRGFMRPQRRHVALPLRFGRAWVQYQPLGVVGIMSPWNYPLALTLMPLATATAPATGNRQPATGR
jgi:coniferyl-aldehyde dehydrogenase